MVQLHPAMPQIIINGVALDPDAPQVFVPVVSSHYVLVQVVAPLTRGQKAALAEVNAKPLEYVAEDTYVCRYEALDLAPIRTLPFVAWVSPYLAGFKISHALLAHEPFDEVLVDIVLHRDVDPRGVLAKLGELKPSRGKFRARIAANKLRAIASIDEVRHIEPVGPKQLWNNVARWLIGADHVQERAALEGAGQIIAVCDTGLDLGNPLNLPEAFVGRVLKLYALGRPTASDPNGHGTHVCGSLLGDGMSEIYGPIRGAAPKAKLVMQSVLDDKGGLGGLPDDLWQLLQPAYADGARVHSSSWGDTRTAYSQEAHDIDSFVWAHRDLVVVVAAGNTGTIGSPATARNCITVGATDIATSPKPDLVAPGMGILSTRSRATELGTNWGLSLDPNYFFEGGTSMATPLVAGCAAVVREYLLSDGVQLPSAALVKAMLINGADPQRRVNIAASVKQDPDIVLLRYWDEDTKLDTGEAKNFSVTVIEPALLKVTLVWTDAPGETLQNDLDLTVTAGGNIQLGNAARGSMQPDRTNNVEEVVMSVPAGQVLINVRAHRTALFAQPFALVVRASA
jgi:serine protease AprX